MFWTLIKIINKLGLLRYINTSYTLNVANKKIIVPVMGNLSLLSISEPWMTKVLMSLKPSFGGTFIDVGVNLGQTLIKAYSVLDQLNYVGFEPNPGCVYYVRELIKLNRFQNCNILPVAVSNEASILSLHFFYDDESDSTASMLDLFRPDQNIDHSINIPVFNLHYFKPFLPDASNSILKIDVEGAELEVLQGLEDWIVANKPIIIIEILPIYNVANIYRLQRQQQLEHLLNKWDYTSHRIDKLNITIEKVETIGVHSNLEYCDYILCPRSKSDQISLHFIAQ